ncbi:hypothetical protein HAX54_032645, partial [Datura stramonium]|nr:hypothetical protein [Datura stramonium]
DVAGVPQHHQIICRDRVAPFLDALPYFCPNLVVELYGGILCFLSRNSRFHETHRKGTEFVVRVATKGDQLQWVAQTIAIGQLLWATIGGEIPRQDLRFEAKLWLYMMC